MGCILFKEIQKPKVDFQCPECGIIPPEIIDINVDNKNIKFQCMKCAEKEYNSHFFREVIDNNTTCYYCKIVEDDNNNIYWLKEDRENFDTIRINILENYFTKDAELNKSIEIIKEKNEQLKKIINFNKQIKQNCEKYQNNYLYLESFKNICESFDREKLRDSKDLKFIFTTLENENEISKDAINDFYVKKGIKIERKEEYLLLNNKELNDEHIKCISKIKFNQLKELDLSKNEITSIESLCNMSFPFLEFLNLSHNKIKNIKPLGEKYLKKLKYLFIQNNQIEDINVFLKEDFPTFEILRLENNRTNQNPYSMVKLNELYEKNKKILIQSTEKIDEIKNKYRIENTENVEEIKVEETEEGDIILNYLFIIIPSDNNIRRLKLKKNAIKDPSILNRIQLKFLEELDLSVNNIRNLNFLNKMNAPNLKKLFLDNNNINNISLLFDIRKTFTNLKNLTINNNNFSSEDSRYTNLIQNLNSYGINTNN